VTRASHLLLADHHRGRHLDARQPTTTAPGSRTDRRSRSECASGAHDHRSQSSEREVYAVVGIPPATASLPELIRVSPGRE